MAGKIKVPSELVPSQSNKIMLRSKYIYDDVKGHTQEEVNQALGEQIESKVIEAGGVNWDTVPTAGSNNAVKSKDIKAALEKVTGYFVLDSNVLESTVAKTVTVADFPALALGGSIKIKMLTKNTATNPTLRIGPANATAYPLYYNNERASGDNSWETNEVISVYFDGTNYQASNAQGGGGKAEKIKYDHSQSGLATDNVQGALDEIAQVIINKEGIAPTISVAKVIDSNNTWKDVSGMNGEFVSVVHGKKYRIVVDNSNSGIIAFMTQATQTGVHFAGGATSRTVLPASSDVVLTAPDDANYLYYTQIGTTPATVQVYDVGTIQDDIDTLQDDIDTIENKFITREVYVSKLSQAIPSKTVQYLSTSLGLVAGQTYRVVIELGTPATSSMEFRLRNVASSSTPSVNLAYAGVGAKTIEVTYTPSSETNYQYLSWYSNESTSNSFDIYFYIDEEIENVAPAFTAEGTSYDNSSSELSATNVQEAIDEIKNNIDKGIEYETEKESVSVSFTKGNIAADGTITTTTASPYRYTNVIPVTEGQIIYTIYSGNYTSGIASYNDENAFVRDKSVVCPNKVVEARYVVPEGISGIRICFKVDSVSESDFYVQRSEMTTLLKEIKEVRESVTMDIDSLDDRLTACETSCQDKDTYFFNVEEDGLYFVDRFLNIGGKFDSNGFHAININE